MLFCTKKVHYKTTNCGHFVRKWPAKRGTLFAKIDVKPPRNGTFLHTFCDSSQKQGFYFLALSWGILQNTRFFATWLLLPRGIIPCAPEHFFKKSKNSTAGKLLKNTRKRALKTGCFSTFDFSPSQNTKFSRFFRVFSCFYALFTKNRSNGPAERENPFFHFSHTLFFSCFLKNTPRNRNISFSNPGTSRQIPKTPPKTATFPGGPQKHQIPHYSDSSPQAIFFPVFGTSPKKHPIFPIRHSAVEEVTLIFTLFFSPKIAACPQFAFFLTLSTYFSRQHYFLQNDSMGDLTNIPNITPGLTISTYCIFCSKIPKTRKMR